MRILFSSTLSFFRALLFDTLDNAICPYLVRVTGISIFHPKSAKELDILMDFQIPM